MKSSKQVSFWVAFVMILFLSMVFFAGPSFGQQKYVLKFNHVLGQKEPYHQGFYELGKSG